MTNVLRVRPLASQVGRTGAGRGRTGRPGVRSDCSGAAPGSRRPGASLAPPEHAETAVDLTQNEAGGYQRDGARVLHRGSSSLIESQARMQERAV